MAKIYYYYNTESCNYERAKASPKEMIVQYMTFFLLTGILATACIYLYQANFRSLKEIHLWNRNQQLVLEWKLLSDELALANKTVNDLEYKDDKIYRVILDTDPIPESIREGGTGGHDRYGEILRAHIPQQEIILKAYHDLENLKKKLYIQSKSYDDIIQILEKKEKEWASRPAIQPISNAELVRIASGFNPARFNPVAKRIMPHKGIDFTASKGTPIYATGDGVVASEYRSSTYGNVIFLNHGYNYQTRYAHMSKFNVKNGQRVKRGEVIGYVGNTGRSAGAHLHYEVLYKGVQINPINFFQRDLSNEEYERLIEISQQSHSVLD